MLYLEIESLLYWPNCDLLRLDISRLKLDPRNTFDCGQAFRWKPLDPDGAEWVGIVGDTVLRVSKDYVTFVSEPRSGSQPREQEANVLNYLRADDNLEWILSSLPKDEFLDRAIEEFKGLRLLSQDPWECLVSFICSINKNIPSIKIGIENICRKFGSPIHSALGTFFTFPSAAALENARESDILSCKVGFRSKYIKYIAGKVTSGELNLELLRKLTYEKARDELISELSGKTFGVGPKVADCELLFSLGKTEAFPIDVWMARCIKNQYSDLPTVDLIPLFHKASGFSMSAKNYSSLSKAMRSHFGNYAGYAQQYLYVKTRKDFLGYSR